MKTLMKLTPCCFPLKSKITFCFVFDVKNGQKQFDVGNATDGKNFTLILSFCEIHFVGRKTERKSHSKNVEKKM